VFKTVIVPKLCYVMSNLVTITVSKNAQILKENKLKSTGTNCLC